MRRELLREAKSHLAGHQRRRMWRKVVGTLACVVVFCTTYALILPAITLEKTANCGKEEHVHTENCYAQAASQEKAVPVCSPDSLGIHRHTDACRDENGEYTCGYSDFVVHQHNASCYDESGTLWCPLPERKAHTHSESCYAQPEAQTAHTHTDECYTAERGELTCAVPEGEGAHTHGEGCYDESGELVCQLAESQGHAHTDECYDWNRVLICELPEEPAEEPAQPQLICDKPEIVLHTHEDGCYDENGNLTCGKQQVLEHVHTQDCFQTGTEEAAPTLICGLEEHTHTEGCFLRDGLTEEEWAQVDRAAALISALPTRQEIEEKLTALEEAGDEEGYDAALTQFIQTAAEAQTACDALTEQQREKLPDITRLEELAWLLTTTLPDTGDTIKPMLDGDYAYIKDLTIIDHKDGAATLDSTAGPGNDTSDSNGILRTFDLATYTLQFTIDLRQNANKYKEGKIYFRFVLPVSTEEAEFDMGGMSWLETVKDPKITDKPEPGDKPQVLAGYYTLTPSPGNDAAIAPGFGQVTVAIRALNMKNGETITPRFSMRLDYNSDDDYKSVKDTLTISAAPQYNVELTRPDSANTVSGIYDFSTGDGDAPNQGMGSVKGYMMGFGLSLQLRSDRNRGLLGMELPDGNTPISFDLDLSSVYYAQGHEKNRDGDYRLLLWSGGGNSGGDAQGRATNTLHTAIVDVPYNQYQDPASAYEYNSCNNGGTWTFTQEGNVLHVTVTGFQIDASRFPYGTSVKSEKAHKYYEPSQDPGQNWSGITAAVFSAGEFWLLQPVESLADKTPIETVYQGAGQFTISVTDRDLTVGTAPTAQTRTDDDVASRDYRLGGGGTVSADLTYNKYHNANFNGSLIEKSFLDDSDWAALGQSITLRAQLSQTDAEGGSELAAADLLVKFDGDFFEPDTAGEDREMKTPEAAVYMPSYARGVSSYYWVTKPDGSNWIDDEEMKRATEDDLIYYKTLAEIPSGHIPVGLLLEARGKNWGVYPVCINGKVKETSQPGQVYMMTQANLVWTRNDVANALGVTADELTNEQCEDYVKHTLPSRNPDTSGNKLQLIDEGEKWNPDSDYIAPTNRQDYYATGELAFCAKASYDTGGYHPGLHARNFQDSCLVVPYHTTITKSTAQVNDDGTPKTAYGISQNQRVVDFVLRPQVQGYLATGEAVDATRTVTVTVRDILPAQLLYLNGTAYLGGTYLQDPNCEKPGTVTGGQALDPVITTENGKTVLTWTFPTTVDLQADHLNALGPIYFSCQINEEAVTGNIMSFHNEVTAMTSGEQFRGYDKKHGNIADFGISVNRTAGASITKLADQHNADWWEPVGFLMNAGNNSANPLADVLITDTLPARGKNDGTVYDGPLVITQLQLGANTAANAQKLMESLQFYYTTDPAYAGLEGTELRDALSKPEEVLWQDHLTASGSWHPLTEPTGFTNQGSWYGGVVTGLPTEAEQQSEPITAIVAVGTLPANQTLKMHITLKLPQGKDNDNLVNYLSMSVSGVDLRTFATTRLVSRSLSGLTWLDSNTNGIQNMSERMLPGVKVSLLKLKDGCTDLTDPGSYEPFHYKNDPAGEEVTVVTGQTVSAQTGVVGDLPEGNYRFTDLPSGVYAVRFTSGSTMKIESFTASPENQGGDDTVDSDGVPTYEDGKLLHTVITNIDLRDQGGKPNSDHNDSGFYKRGHELPKSGGAGTTRYTVGGLLAICAGCLLLYSNQKRRKEDTASS